MGQNFGKTLKRWNVAFASCAVMALTVSCGSKSTTTSAEVNAAEQWYDITGQWNIENIVFNDSTYVRPAEEDPEAQQYITFEDKNYHIHTNCNTIFGEYSLKGDSITIGSGGMTRMLCENMATEEALTKILPNIVTIDVENDSIVRLNSRNTSEYIVLRKATEQDNSVED